MPLTEPQTFRATRRASDRYGLWLFRGSFARALGAVTSQLRDTAGAGLQARKQGRLINAEDE